MIKRIVPVGLILAIACHGSDGIAPNPVSSDISDMAVGEVRVFNPADIRNGIDLPSVSSARDFAIIVGNTGPHDVVANYVVRADRSAGGSFGISAPSDVSAQSSILVDQIPLARTPQQAVDNKVRAFERKNLTLRSPSDPSGASRFSLRQSVQAPAFAVPVPGDRINLNVPDASSTNLCTNYFQTQAIVASVSSKAILAVDTLDGTPALLFTQQQMDSITTEFDNVIYPTDASYYNTPTDIDGNGGHIIILFTGRINKLTPPGTTGGYVTGFFFAGDLFPPTNPGGPPGSFCTGSNRGEIFYLLSPDPTGKFNNVRTTSSVRQGTRGTIAHEFQHMINAGNRYLNPAVTNFESTWLDEALAHFAEDAVGRASRGFTDLQTLAYTDVLPCSPCSQANDFDAFFYQNLARLTYWMDKPDLYSPTSALADTSLAVRGAAWALVRYAADDYSSAGPRAFTRKLAAGPDTGITNFSAAAAVPIDTLISGWLVSMYADHLGISGLNPKYQYRSWNFRSVMPPVAKSLLKQSTATYPLSVLGIGGGSDNIAATNRSGSGTYYRLTAPANSGAKNVKVLDTIGNPANFAGEHVYVLRVQ